MRISPVVKAKLRMGWKEAAVRVAVQQSVIALGAWISAMAYVIFQLPYNLAAGGVAGLGIIVNHYSQFPVGTFYLLVNIPLFFVGFWSLGRWRFIWSSLVAVLVFSFASDFLAVVLPKVLHPYPVTHNTLLAAVYAGILYGVGTGLVYRYGGTVGGTSILARIVYNKTGFPLSQSYLFTDLLIIILAGVVFSWETALLALLSLVLSGLLSDYVLEGSSQVRTLLIITDKAGPICEAVMHELQRGVTYWDVTGGFSGKQRKMVYFTVLRSRIYDVKYIISSIDPDAFMVVGVSQQTWGGYNAPKISERS